MLKQATLALAFASLSFALSSISLKSQQVFEGLNSQGSASTQQLEWERMLVGESEEADQAAARARFAAARNHRA